MIEKIIIPATLSIIGGINENNVTTINNDFSEDKMLKIENLDTDYEFSYKSVKDTIFNKKQIAEKVINIVSDKLGVAKEEVKLNSSFTNDLGADSLDTVELIMEFEKEFNIAIPDEIAEKIATISQSINYINEVLNNAVFLYSETKYKGNIKKIISNYSCYSFQTDIVKGGLSSIIIPTGYVVILFSNVNYSGKSITIDASKKQVKIKKFSKIRKKSYITFSNNKNEWDDIIKSIKILKADKN